MVGNLGGLIGAGDLFVGGNATITNSLDVLGHINLATTSATQGTNNFISFPTQSAAPAAPEDGRTIVYARVSDGEVSLFSRNSTTESLLGGAGGGGCTNLNCLSDVAIVSVANNELLVYNSGTGNFENVSQPTVLETQGGTGIITYTTGDLLFADASNSLAKLGIGSAGKFLTVSGGIPAWGDAMALTGNQTITSGIKTFNTLPENDGDTCTTDNQFCGKAYIDAVGSGFLFKEPVRLASTGNIAATSTLATVDSIVTVAEDRVLLKDQTNSVNNGCYVAKDGSDWVLCTDSDTDAEVNPGTSYFTTVGTVNAGVGFAVITDDPITPGTTAIEFTQISSTSGVTAGDGIDVAGTSVSVNFKANDGFQIDTTELAHLFNNSMTANASGLAVNTTSPFIWSNIQTFNGLATTTDLHADFLNASSTTFDSVNVFNTFEGAGLSDCDGSSNAVTWDSTGKQFGCNSISGGGGGGGGTGGGFTIVHKASDESRTNDTTLTDDADLKFAIAANETWGFTFWVQADIHSQPDIKFSINTPASPTSCIFGAGEIDSATGDGSITCGVSSGQLNGNGTEMYIISGSIVNGSNAGTVALQWAQNTSKSQATTVKAGSYMLAVDAAGISTDISDWNVNSLGQLTPTTSIGVLLPGNATTSGYLVVGTTNPTINLSVGDLFVGNDGFFTGDLAVTGGDITSSSGAIAFGNENLSTTGTLAAGVTTLTGNTKTTGTMTMKSGVDTTSTTDINLIFGGTNIEQLRWDGSEQGFVLSDDLRMVGDLQVDGGDIGITADTNLLGLASEILTVRGHYVASGSAPSLSSCGTTPSITGTDTAGIITAGTGIITACTVTFATAYSSEPACIVTSDNSVSFYFISAKSTSAFTITGDSPIGADVINYICIGL